MKGTKGRAKCPVCNTGGLTKRSLEAEEEVVGRQVALVKKFFEVEMEELKGELDFLNMTVVNKVLALAFYVLYDQNFMFKASHEAETSPHKVKPPPPPNRSSRGVFGLWNKQKVSVNGRKVYGRRALSPEVNR